MTRRTLRVGLFSVDPPALSYYASFDPETNSITSQIAEGLVTLDIDGVVKPSLATAWQQVSPVELELELRQGVLFHNGDSFDADDVLASFAAHTSPTPSPAYMTLLRMIKQVRKLDRYRIRVESFAPDVLLLRRLLFLQVYPRRVLETSGRDACNVHPIGTGAYKLSSYTRGREIVLERFPQHWAQQVCIDELRLPIVRQKEWVHRLAIGQLDVALNLDSHDALRARRIPGLRGASREAGLSQYFSLHNAGPLADVRVRRALNHAVNRRILADLTEHGFGSPQRSMASRQIEGYTEIEPYQYSPELARRLLREAGLVSGLRLRGLVSETSTALYFAVREFLSRIDVTLEAEIVPRGLWMQMIMGIGVERFKGDFAVTSCDNPLLHSLFMHFGFSFSEGPGALVKDPELDRLLIAAASAVDDPQPAIAALERHHRDQAHMLFTVEQHTHAAWREGVEVQLPRSGHFDSPTLWSLRVSPEYRSASAEASMPPAQCSDFNTLLDATSHTGTFYLPPQVTLREPIAQRIWTNLTESEQRWHVQNEPMLRELVSSIEARTNLANVLSSTDRVAIAGYNREGRLLFHNRGYDLMFGSANTRPAFEYLGDVGDHGWPAIRAAVDSAGGWQGPVHIVAEGRPRGVPEKLFLTVSQARDEDALSVGYTLVFSDFSGEEERIRTAATRTILDNVSYGLFMTDQQGRMQSGYSASCRNIFVGGASADLSGRPLVELLGLDPRRADHFRAAYMQVIDDLLPPEVTLAQLPARIPLGARTFSLRGSLVRAEDQSVTGVLFTILDISPLIAAEREAEHHRATVMLLRHRDSFEAFAMELSETLSTWSRASVQSNDASQHIIRAQLHTAKGVLAQFALTDLAEHIHALEDRAHIDAKALAELHRRMLTVLDSHGLSLADKEPAYTVSESFVRDIESFMLSAGDANALRAHITLGLQRLREKRAGDLLGPLGQAAETLAQRRDKRVKVEVRGADIRVPVSLGHVLGRLVHLTRNAVDHGIEPEDERQRAGKPPVGVLTIELVREASVLRVRVRDDGRGIDSGNVVERAVGLSIVTRAQAERMSEQERLQLIFRDGLSTAETVTDSSGRGVGMGATKAEVEAAGGRIEVESERGRGTTITIVLPLP